METHRLRASFIAALLVLAGSLLSEPWRDVRGRGRTDAVVWRPPNGAWYVDGISTTQWGVSDDVPLAS